MICGVDYGSKLAGTTVIARELDGKVILSQSVKGKDADQFILDIVEQENLRLMALDAPLSLPARLQGDTDKSDYFYRECDRKLKAMSPMFIGGLTARAMQLRDQLQSIGVEVIEAYPKAIASTFPFSHHYQKKQLTTLPDFCRELEIEFPHCQLGTVDNWHQVDAVLAFLIAWKYHNGLHTQAGDPDEGVIYF